MRFSTNWLIFFYFSLGLCLKYRDKGQFNAARIGIDFNGNINKEDAHKGFLSYSRLNFTLEDCKAMKLCPVNMQSGEEFLNNLINLDAFEVLSFVLNKNEGELRQPINATSYWYEWSRNKFKGKALGKHVRPLDFHFADKYKLIITVPIYIFCSVIAAIVYLNKRKLLTSMNFKFSNISRILIKYLSIKLAFGVIYLVFLIMYDDLKMIHLGKYKVLAGLTIFKYILGIVSFLLVVLLAFGYCTSFFTFTNRKSVLWKVLGLTLLYGIQSFPKFFYELQDLKNQLTVYLPGLRSRLPVPLAVGFIILYIMIICILGYIAYSTYNDSMKRDARFLLSFQIILAGAILSPLIVVPYGRSAIPNFIKNKYLLNDRGADESYSEGVHVPDVIELFVIGVLIYIWRDLKYVEKDDDTYEKLDSNEYE